jgi:hypothetical protein
MPERGGSVGPSVSPATGGFYNLPHFSLHFYYLPFCVSLTCGGHVANNKHFEEKWGKS